MPREPRWPATKRPFRWCARSLRRSANRRPDGNADWNYLRARMARTNERVQLIDLMKATARQAAVFLLLFVFAMDLLAQQPADLTSKSIEDLMKIEVTSVSKKEQKLARTAAAVF